MDHFARCSGAKGRRDAGGRDGGEKVREVRGGGGRGGGWGRGPEVVEGRRRGRGGDSGHREIERALLFKTDR